LLRAFYYAEQIPRYRIDNKATFHIIYSCAATVDDISDFPNLARHLEPYKALMATRRETAQGKKPWFHLHWPRSTRYFEEPAIVSVRQTQQPVFSYSPQSAYCDLAVNVLSTRRGSQEEPLFSPHLAKTVLQRCALYLNSKFVENWLRMNGKMKGDTFQIDQGPLKRVPIPRGLLESSELSKSLDGVWEGMEQHGQGEGEVREAVEDVLNRLLW